MSRVIWGVGWIMSSKRGAMRPHPEQISHIWRSHGAKCGWNLEVVLLRRVERTLFTEHRKWRTRYCFKCKYMIYISTWVPLCGATKKMYRKEPPSAAFCVFGWLHCSAQKYAVHLSVYLRYNYDVAPSDGGGCTHIKFIHFIWSSHPSPSLGVDKEKSKEKKEEKAGFSFFYHFFL